MAGEIKTATTTRFRRYSALTTWFLVLMAGSPLSHWDKQQTVLRTRAGYLNATMLTCDAVVVGAVSELTSSLGGLQGSFVLTSESCLLDPTSTRDTVETSTVQVYIPTMWKSVASQEVFCRLAA